MKDFKYAPQVKDDSGNLIFEGYLVVSIPNEVERLETAEKFSFKTDEKGEASTSEVTEQAKAMYILAKEHIKEIDVKYGSFEIKSLDDLGYFEEGTQLLTEVSLLCLKGISLGNVLR